MDKTLRNVIIGVLCVMAFSFFYYLVLFLPGQKKAEREDAIRKEQAAALEKESKERAAEITENEKRLSYYECLRAANQDYQHNWNISCKRLGLPEKCSLPSDLGKTHDERNRHNENLCVNRLK